MTKLAYSLDGEMFDFDSMQELIEMLQDRPANPEDSIIGEIYWVGEATHLNPKNIYDFCDLADTLYDRIADILGFDSIDDLCLSGEDEFNTFIKGFLDRNSNLSSFYTVGKVQEKKITEEDLK